jgi:hypothetical protein
MDTTFPRSYECEWLLETPPTTALPHDYYPGASVQGGRDGVLVKVRSECGQEWLGRFAFGRLTQKGVSGLFTTPDPDRLCVVAAGEGYFVSVNTPTSWEEISAVPILDVRPIAASKSWDGENRVKLHRGALAAQPRHQARRQHASRHHCLR